MGTLVERTNRYLVPVALPDSRDALGSDLRQLVSCRRPGLRFPLPQCYAKTVKHTVR